MNVANRNFLKGIATSNNFSAQFTVDWSCGLRDDARCMVTYRQIILWGTVQYGTVCGLVELYRVLYVGTKTIRSVQLELTQEMIACKETWRLFIQKKDYFAWIILLCYFQYSIVFQCA